MCPKSPRTIVPDGFVLASGSKARRELLQSVGLPFEVIPSGLDERPPSEAEVLEPHKYTVALALDKATAVGECLDKAKELAERTPFKARRSLVVGCDTCVYLDGNILGKPPDLWHAAKCLRLLSGRWHRVITGMCVLNTVTGLVREASIESSVRMRTLNCEEQEAYLETGEWLGAAGGYRAQGRGSSLIECIRGSYSNVVGLPLEALYGIFRTTDTLE